MVIKSIIRWGILGWLTACASGQHTLPVSENVVALRLIQYQNEQGQGLIPVARNVGETKTKLWRRWLSAHHGQWQSMPYTKIEGKTKWCAQWLQAETGERICRRDDVLVWFGRGVMHDHTALQQAEKIWALK